MTHIATSVLAIAIISTNVVSISSYGNNTASTKTANPVVEWNQLLTRLGLSYNVQPPYLAQDYSLLHVAMYDALLELANKSDGDLPQIAAIAGAASEVLTYLYPDNATQILELETTQRATIQGYDKIQIIASAIGHDIGKRIVEYERTNLHIPDWNGSIPTGTGIWTGTDPTGPLFGHQKTYILNSAAEFQPPPPYPFSSPADVAEVDAVIDAAHTRTPEQIAIVHKWADLPPPTIWNNILNNRIESHDLTIYESARASAYLNAAMYDSFVTCWYTKFTYWTARPIQRITLSDPTFNTVVPTPNFPSYTSGHSTVSSAASIILGHLFPDEALYFLSEANEAAMSRLWAGIHFQQDNKNGFAVGQQIGKKYVEDMLKPPHPFVVPFA